MDRQYLVILSHDLDDLPIRLCHTYETARHCAENLKPEDAEQVLEILRRDASTPGPVSIITFENCLPVSWELIKDFNDEEVHAD